MSKHSTTALIGRRSSAKHVDSLQASRKCRRIVAEPPRIRLAVATLLLAAGLLSDWPPAVLASVQLGDVGGNAIGNSGSPVGNGGNGGGGMVASLGGSGGGSVAGGGMGEIYAPRSAQLGAHEPSCEELRAMWRFSKRQSRAAEMTNEIPTYRDPFAYNVWDPYVPTTRSLGGRVRINSRYRDLGRPVFGRVLHREPQQLRMRDASIGGSGVGSSRPRTYSDISRLYGVQSTSGVEMAAPRRHQAQQLRFGGSAGGGGGFGANSLTPQKGSFQVLKDLVWTERARELNEQRRIEEMAARAAVLKEVSNGRGFNIRRHHPQPAIDSDADAMGLITSAALGYDAEMLSAPPAASIHASVAPIADEQRALLRGNGNGGAGGASPDFMSRPPMGQSYQVAEAAGGQQQQQQQKSQSNDGGAATWQAQRMAGIVGGGNGGGGTNRLMRDRNGATAMRQRPASSASYLVAVPPYNYHNAAPPAAAAGNFRRPMAAFRQPQPFDLQQQQQQQLLADDPREMAALAPEVTAGGEPGDEFAALYRRPAVDAMLQQQISQLTADSGDGTVVDSDYDYRF